jgi:tRNA modification GTPase
VESVFQPQDASARVSFGQVRLDRSELEFSAVRYQFLENRSYTGELLVELHLVGSPPLVEALLEELEARGARAAGPGEFTRRAFLSGRLDLAQAEGVCALVSSSGEAQRRQAMNTLSGGPSRVIHELIDSCKEVAALWVAALDFAEEEDIEEDTIGEGVQLLQSLRERFEALIVSPPEEVAGEGLLSVAICGPAGAGKSTLFNRLVGSDQAIVSSSPGTTRDILEGHCEFEGIRFRILDTVGVREVGEGVERQALDRLEEILDGVSLRLVVLDASRFPDRSVLEFVETVASPRLLVVNKTDLAPADPVLQAFDRLPERVVTLSVQEGDGLDVLRETLLEFVGSGMGTASGAVLGARQRSATVRALAAIDRSREVLESGLGVEVATIDLEEAIRFLGEVVGEVDTEDILDLVFQRFCIGK